MERFERAYGHWLLRFRWLVILLSVGAVLFAASGGKYLGFTTNYRVFFSENNPQLLAFDALEAQYSKNDNVLFVLTPKDGNVFIPETLGAIEELTAEAWKIPFSIRVDSLSNFQNTEAEADDLIVGDLYTDARSLQSEDLQKIREIALHEPLLINRLISSDGSVAGVNVTIQLPGKDEMGETPAVVSYARDLVDKIQQAYPDIDIRLTGMILMNNAFSESSQGDMQSLVPLSFALMLLTLGFLIRGVSGTLVTTLVILLSIVAAMGVAGFIGYPITPPSASSPTIILTVAIANCVHILMTMLHEMRRGREKKEAIVESLRVNLQPVFLTSLTTAIGFLTMNFSEVPPFQHLGNIVAIGVVVSFLLSVTFLPAIMSLLPVRVRVREDGRPHAMQHFAEFVVKKRTLLLWGFGGFVILLTAAISRNELNDVFVHYFDESVDFRTASDYTTEHLTGLYIADYSLESGEEGGISSPAFLHDVAAFAGWYRQQPETIHVNTLTDIMKRLNKNLHGDDPAYYRLPVERNLSAQYLLLYEMSLPYGLDLNNQINVDKSATRMTVTLKTLSTNEVLDLMERARAWQLTHAPAIKSAVPSGPTVMFAHIGKRNIVSMLIGTTLALVLISLILIAAMRSFKIGMVSLMPNLVPAAMGFGFWGLLQGEVGLALSVVTGMTLGIVVDDTVHFLSKYLRARREKGFGSPDAVRYAFNSVGRALVVTSIVLVVGFLVLSQSAFKLNSDMGLLTAIVIAFALAADFLLLPALLMKIEEKSNEDKEIDSDRAVAQSGGI